MKDNETAAPRRPGIPKERQICGIAGLLQILQEMEEEGETRKTIIGEVGGPFFSRAGYGCVIRIGTGSNESHTSAHRKSA